MTLEIQVLHWDRHKNGAGLNRLMDHNPSLLMTGSPNVLAADKIVTVFYNIIVIQNLLASFVEELCIMLSNIYTL